MKSYIILFVSLTMLIKPLWPVVEYIMNYDYIVNVLCENKDKPELQCDGKCYLAQMLAEESQQNEKNPFGEEQSKTEIQHPAFFQSLFLHEFKVGLSSEAQNNFKATRQLTSTLFTTDISQPPELA